jgi:hypothetical protein
MMPEVSGYPLERIKELFENKKWYLIGCTQNKPLRVKDEVALGDDVPQFVMQREQARESQDEDVKERADDDDKELGFGGEKENATKTKTVDA